MTDFLDISAALDSRLAAMTSVPPVAWENSSYEPVQGTTFLRPTLLPAPVTQASLGGTGQDEHLGIYQIDVFVEAGNGKGAAYVMADLVADQFARGLDLTYNGLVVTITQASRQTGSTDNGWFIVPVDINYRAFTAAR